MTFYRKHIFFCTKQKDNGNQCCADANAEAMWQYARQRCKQEGLTANNHVRVSRSGCLGRCAEGPCAVIYPEGRWFFYRNKNDVDRIIDDELAISE